MTLPPAFIQLVDGVLDSREASLALVKEHAAELAPALGVSPDEVLPMAERVPDKVSVPLALLRAARAHARKGSAARRAAKQDQFAALLARGFTRRYFDLAHLLATPLPSPLPLVSDDRSVDVLVFELADGGSVPIAAEAILRLKALPARFLKGATAHFELVPVKHEVIKRGVAILVPAGDGSYEPALVVRAGSLTYVLRDRREAFAMARKKKRVDDRELVKRYRETFPSDRRPWQRVRLFFLQEREPAAWDAPRPPKEHP